MSKIKVFVVDDSAIVREILTEQLYRDSRIEVVGSAVDPYVARDKLEKIDVDVITLDIEMPRMDGLTFLRKLMKHYPKPVIIVSSLAESSSRAALKALELGAADVVPKPGGPFSVEDVVSILIDRILSAREADLSKLQARALRVQEYSDSRRTVQRSYLTGLKTSSQLIAVGASTGGTIAMEEIFRDWAPDFPPTLAVIHMPERFTSTFASRLNDICQVTVKEAENGERLIPGTVYVAPGNYHMLLRSKGTERTLRVASGPKVCNQRPAVDVLFNSVADQAGQHCIGILLTGMGKDGAQGQLKIKNAGGYTIAQDEESSIVWGMPREAVALGAADKVLSLGSITEHIRGRFSQKKDLPGIRNP